MCYVELISVVDAKAAATSHLGLPRPRTQLIPARLMYEYAAKVLDVHDGDTLHVEVDLGVEVSVRLTLRLYGINAPELATPEGKVALIFLQQTLGAPNYLPLTIRTVKDHREKYGRYLATLILPDGTDVNALMVSSGHAVVYLL